MAELDTTPTPDYARFVRLDGKVFVVMGAPG